MLGVVLASAGLWPIVLGALALVPVLIFLRHRPFALPVFFILAGLLVGASTYHVYTAKHFARIAWYAQGPCDCVARVKDVTFFDRGDGGRTKMGKISLKVLKTRRTKLDDWQNVNDEIVLYRPAQWCKQVGDCVLLKKLVCARASLEQERYLLEHGLSGSSWAVKKMILLLRPAWSVRRWFCDLRNWVVSSLKNKLSPRAYALFAPMFLGVKVYDAQTYDLFKQWGLSYYLVRSGIHLILIFFLLELLLRLLFIPFTLRALLTLIVCIVYSALTGGTIPFIRAVFALCLTQMCHMIKVPVHAVHLLNVVLVGCLVYNPYALFLLDFQLTFCLTYALLFILSKDTFFTACQKS